MADEQKKYGPILPGKDSIRPPHVLPNWAELVNTTFDGKIRFWGYDAVVNVSEYLYELGIGRPWREARKVLSFDYLKPEIDKLKGIGGGPAAPPAPGGTYRAGVDGGNWDEEVLQKAYQLLADDLKREGYSINDEAFFNDPDVQGYEDGAGNIRLSHKLRSNDYKKLVVLAHEGIGHENGEPYGRDEELAKKYVSKAMEWFAGKSKVTNINDYRKSANTGSILPSLKAA